MADVGNVIARGNVAVITGGAGGIGLAVAEVSTFVCDTASDAAVAELAEYTLATYGAVHLVFNNAGIVGVGDAWNGPIELWRKVVDINLFGVVHGIRSFLPIMNEQGVGHIVSTASMAGLVAMPLPVERMQRAASQTNPPTPFDEADAAPADGQN